MMDKGGEREAAFGFGLPAPVSSEHAWGKEIMKNKNDDPFTLPFLLDRSHSSHLPVALTK